MPDTPPTDWPATDPDAYATALIRQEAARQDALRNPPDLLALVDEMHAALGANPHDLPTGLRSAVQLAAGYLRTVRLYIADGVRP